jgi:hypothetical protein
MKTDVNAVQFTNTNVIAIVERASEMLMHMRKLQLDLSDMETLCTHKINTSANVHLDDWEHAAWILARMEVRELFIRDEDPNVERAIPGYNGGFGEYDESYSG